MKTACFILKTKIALSIDEFDIYGSLSHAPKWLIKNFLSPSPLCFLIDPETTFN
jgi:hypothetical protein